MHCSECGVNTEYCVCDIALGSMEDDEELAQDLSELEARDSGKPRCHGCYFFACVCAKGHRERLSK